MPDFITPYDDESTTEFHLRNLISALERTKTIPEEHRDNLWYGIDKSIESLPEIDDKAQA